MEEVKKNKINEFNAYSDEVSEVLTSAPSSWYYAGNSIIGLIILTLLFLSWLVKFPDVIRTDAFLTSTQTPIKLVSKTSGNLRQLYVKDGDWVEKDSILAVLTNNEKVQDINILKEIFKKIKHKISNDYSLDLTIPQNLEIGEFTPLYAQIKSLHYKLSIITNELSITEEDNKIQLQIFDVERMKNKLKEEGKLIARQIQLREKNYKRQLNLFNEGFVSEYNVEQSENELTNIRNQEKRVKFRISEIDARIKNLKRQQTAILNTDRRNVSDLRLEINSLVEQLLSQIKIWENNHVIRAPFSGTCSFISLLSENQYINNNTELLYISPNFDELEVRGTLPIEKSGLVNEGQRVILKLKPFPYKEYGSLNAVVDHISYVANEKGYVYFAKLENQLVTNFGKEIKFKPLMQADAEIIVEDTRLIERIFSEIRNIFKS